MKRPMCVLAVAWLAGLLQAAMWPEFKTNNIIITYFILIFIGLIVLKKYPHYLNLHVQKEWYPQFTLLLVLLPCLFLLGNFRMEQTLILQEQRELAWEQLEAAGETHVLIRGVVKEKHCEEQTKLILMNCTLVGDYEAEFQSMGDCQIIFKEEEKEWLPTVYIGNEIQVYGKFSTYQNAGNPGQFDARSYYMGKGIVASVKALQITILEEKENIPGNILFSLKQRMRKILTALYPEEKAGVLVAMLLGDKDLLADEVETLYRQNGISHILAISGLHISMLCMGLFEGLKKIGVPVKASMAVAVLFLCFYVIFTGASTSSLRAGVMCLVLFGARLFRRSYDLLSSLSLAAIVVTFLRPTELTSAGFLLSFGAMLGVALAQEVEQCLKEERRGHVPWWNALLFSGMIQGVTIPVTLWFFYELSPYSIFLNLVVIPLVSLILGGGIVSVVLGFCLSRIAKLMVGGTYFLLEFYEWIGGITQKLPFSFILMGRPEIWQLVLYYVVLFGAVKLYFVLAEQKKDDKQKNKAGRVCCLAAGMFISVCILFFPERHSAKLLFLDVSQGDSALIMTEEGRTILSDCGSSDVSGVGEYRLAPVLKQNGTLLIDVAVVSHLDFDHTSGIKEILNTMPIYEGRISYAADYQGTVGIAELVLPKVLEKSKEYVELETLAAEKQVAVRYVQAGDMLYQEEELLIECLSPEHARESENDTSLVFLLQTPKLVAWLMGDAEKGSEEAIMKRLKNVDMEVLYKDKLVLLKVGHHGSKTSSGQEFIEFVAPEVAVISCGYQNSYGHPHEVVLNCLKEVGSKVFRTDLQGAVIVEPDRHGEVVIRGFKESR